MQVNAHVAAFFKLNKIRHCHTARGKRENFVNVLFTLFSETCDLVRDGVELAFAEEVSGRRAPEGDLGGRRRWDCSMKLNFLAGYEP